MQSTTACMCGGLPFWMITFYSHLISARIFHLQIQISAEHNTHATSTVIKIVTNHHQVIAKLSLKRLRSLAHHTDGFRCTVTQLLVLSNEIHSEDTGNTHCTPFPVWKHLHWQLFKFSPTSLETLISSRIYNITLNQRGFTAECIISFVPRQEE